MPGEHVLPRLLLPLALLLGPIVLPASARMAPLAQDPTPAESAPSPTAEATPDPAGSPALLTFTLVPEQSEARYRVREQLVGLSLPSDAVGTTRQVSGQIVVDASGAIVREQSQIVVDLSTLQSDQSRRDRFIKGNTLETDRYPTAIFVPAEAPGFPAAIPTAGEVEFRLVGDLTVRDVTRSVTWEAEANFSEHEVRGSASTAITFAEFNMVQPRVGPVLSIEDPIRLEIDFVFTRSGGEAGAAAVGCQATPADALGPFYQPGALERSSVGSGYVLTGVVRSLADCQPIPGAVIEFWLANPSGVYDDDHRATVVAGPQGEYRFESNPPPAYGGRPPHIHVRVSAPGHETLVTQHYPQAGQTEATFDLVLKPAG